MRNMLAISFVATVALPACATTPERTHNPPAPAPDPAPDAAPDPATMREPPGPICTPEVEGTPCDPPDAQCFLAKGWDDCGLNGFECRDGKWADMMTYCNPPGPEED